MVFLKLVECPTVDHKLPGQPPDVFGGVLQRRGAFSLEQVESGQEVVGAAFALETGDELHEDAEDAVA